MTGSETRDRIDGQAADWAARHAIAAMTDEEKAELEAWLMADRRHAGAFLRAQATLHALEDAVEARPLPRASNDDEAAAPDIMPAQRRQGGGARRAIAGGLGVAACAGALFLVVPALRPTPSPIAGQLALADGSTVKLGDNGAISSTMREDSRHILLQRGSATFHVAKDRDRPFIVHSGQVFAEATGTIYSVARVGERGAFVRVTEGSVRVWADGARARAVMLRAGDALTLDPPGSGSGNASAPMASQAFSFDQVTIADATARFNRVNATRIHVADPAIGRIRIMGRFKPDRPAQFARAAAAIARAQVVERDGVIVIQKK